MKKTPLFIAFLISFFSLVIETVFFPRIRLWPFAPCIAIFVHGKTLIKALWLGLFTGLFLDLFSSQFPFGTFSLTHTLAVLTLFRQKKHFFEDKPLSFSLFTALISCFLSFFLLILGPMLCQTIEISVLTCVADLAIMPLVDGLYAFIAFTCPTWIYSASKKYLLQKQLSSKET